MNIFDLNNRLLLNVLVNKVKSFQTFDYIKSVFAERWYNFIVPTGFVNTFDWEAAARVIDKEKERGVEFSYYIKKDTKYKDFSSGLKKRGLEVIMTDSYPIKVITSRFEEEPYKHILVTGGLEDTYVKLSAACFPGWSNNTEFCRCLFEAQKKKGQGDTVTVNYLIEKEGRFVGMYSAVSSLAINLSYLTNMGTLSEFRGQGIQKAAIKFQCNRLLDSGITRAYAIVEPGSISLANFEKLGFQEEARYDTFFFQQPKF